MYIPTVCMLMRSRHSVIHSGGIGVMALTAGDGTMAGDGIVLTTLGDILRVIGAAGMAAVIGDITTTGTVVLAGAGAEVETIGHVIPIIIIVVLTLETVLEVHAVLLTQQVVTAESVQQLVHVVQMEKV